MFTLLMVQESKSIGAEVNWGVRFKDFKDVGNIKGCVFTHLSWQNTYERIKN